jgi:hypothetical protein
MRVIAFLFLLIFFKSFSYGQSYQVLPNWKYIPVNPDFWSQAQVFQGKNDFFGLLSFAESRARIAKDDLVKAEAEYAIVLACNGLGFTYCAYDYAINLLRKYPGSMPAVGSLFILENLVQLEVIIEDDLQRLLNIGNFKELPESLNSMVSYYVYRDNLSRQLKEWQGAAYKGVVDGTYWKNRLKYFKILQLVQAGKLGKAQAALQELEKNVTKWPKFAEGVRLQRARLYYSTKELKDAEAIYARFLSDSRNMGKIILERAWLKYFQKDYSLALGLIESLKSSYFRGATHPEQYILAMVTFRDLCQYEAVEATFKEFELVFKPWIEHLKDNKSLFENKALLALVLNRASNIRLANMIGRIRLERSDIRDSKLKIETREKLLQIYDQGEIRWKDYASQFLIKDLKTASNEFLDYVEQAKLLQYVSGMDKFRLKGRFESRSYKAPEADTFAIQKLFWPVSGEYWWNELNSYRVLVSDQCSQGVSR